MSSWFDKVLVANRGEIAVRLVRALRDLGIQSVAVHSIDDAGALHVRLADEALALAATGPAAYLDGARLIAIAQQRGCDAIHPGYGFLSERADFARAVADAGLVFVGPAPEQLALFGDKARARDLAERCGVPLLPGSAGAVSLSQAQAFMAALPAGAGVMLKAIGGGGGRGMRAVLDAAELPQAFARCTSEARAAFGVEGVYAERLMRRARHLEVQIVGDGDTVMSLGERECTLQRRFQKLVEIAPSPSLSEALRRAITNAALALARAVRYRSLGTFEFLLDADADADSDLPFVFIEANPRLQVEHTVTEQVTGLDLVRLQLGIAAGRTLAELGLDPAAPPRANGVAIQWRINAETLLPDGRARASTGTLARFELPSGPGIRVDAHGFAGAAPSPHFDTLLAKLIVQASGSAADDGGFEAALRRSQRALAECRIEGVATNLALLRAIAAAPEFASQQLDTRLVERQLPQWLAVAQTLADPAAYATESIAEDADSSSAVPVFDEKIEPDWRPVRAPMAARVVQLDAAVGDVLGGGGQLAVLEAMKMEHLLLADAPGRVMALAAQPGQYVGEGAVIAWLQPVAADAARDPDRATHDPAAIRADLQKVIDRHAFTLDANRPRAIEKRHAQGGRSARENIADLCDEGSFLEYGALAIAAQTARRSLADLVEHTPADGMVTGTATVNAAAFGTEAARCAVMSYDYTVLAGTQGFRNHAKTDRLLAIAQVSRLPVVLFAEGGGGRPGDTDMPVVAGLHVHTFAAFAQLNGQVPTIGIVAGRCFAGNAALLGCCDAIIATKSSNIGMGGPTMIEGGGLGTFAPEQIGPSEVQHGNGVIDLLAADEAAAVAAARHYLSFFQGNLRDWQAGDARALRHLVPENRLRAYDTRAVLQALADSGSLLPLRTGFGCGIHIALARIEGRAVGLLANNPLHLGGAIDADAADKAARFMQLCNAHGLPLVSLVDTPGFMVGPGIERQAQVRHVSRMFIAAAHLRVPCFAVVLRKGYGLGAMAMTAGSFHAPRFTVSWPTGEFGGMGLEGAVRLGYRKELEALAAGPERDALYDRLVAEHYRRGHAINMAQTLEIDAVIDPAETRRWLARGLERAPVGAGTEARFVDVW